MLSKRLVFSSMFSSSLPPVVYGSVHVLLTLFLLACVLWCPTRIVLCFCFVFLSLVYPMLPVSLNCPFLIAPSVVFSNVYYMHHHKLMIGRDYKCW